MELCLSVILEKSVFEHLPLRDARGGIARDACSPLDLNLQFHAVFGKMAKIIGFRSHVWDLRPLGSATVYISTASLKQLCKIYRKFSFSREHTYKYACTYSHARTQCV